MRWAREGPIEAPLMEPVTMAARTGTRSEIASSREKRSRMASEAASVTRLTARLSATARRTG